MHRWLPTLLIAALGTLSACRSAESSLIVDVETDLHVGVDFDAVVLELGGTSLRTPTAASMRGEQLLDSALRIESDVEEGTYGARVVLTLGEAEVISTSFTVAVVGRTGVRVLLQSACVDVECGDTTPNCFNQRCVAEGCTTGTEPECGGLGCESETECPAATAACHEASCQAGACLIVDSPDGCADDEYCDPVLACLPSDGSDASVDAGSLDSGFDSGTDSGFDGGFDSGFDAGPVDACDALFGVLCDDFFEGKIKAPNAGAGDEFAGRFGIAIDGDTLALGAYFEDSAGTQLIEDDDAATDAGAVYIFVRSGGSWTLEAYLKGANTDPGDEFGAALALEGDTLVVGAPNEAGPGTGVDAEGAGVNNYGQAGAAYIFARSAGVWTQSAYVKASNTRFAQSFGRSLALSLPYIVVAAPNEDSNATGVGGNETDTSSTDAGAVYVFSNSGGPWVQEAYIHAEEPSAGDTFGTSIDLDGELLVVGARFEDGATTTAVNGSVDDTGTNVGAAYVFSRVTGAWAQEAYLKATRSGGEPTGGTDHWFGQDVAVAGATVAVGARLDADQGAVYVYSRASTGDWTLESRLQPANIGDYDWFGDGVALAAGGDLLAVGAPGEDGNGEGLNPTSNQDGWDQTGAVYLFRRSAGVWTEIAYIKAPGGSPLDQLGFHGGVALTDTTLAASARGEASGPDGTGTSLASAGAAYVWRIGP